MEELAGLGKEDFAPADISVPDSNGSSSTTATGETIKRRGRKPFPRDEFGNIIRPEGSTKSGPKHLRSAKPTSDNRDQRKKEIVKQLVEINPMICQGLCLFMGIPIQYAMGVHLSDTNSPDFGKVFLTPIGKALTLPDQLIDVYGEAGARFAETPLGIKLSQQIGGIAPYLFILMALFSTTLWMVQVVKVRPQMKDLVEEMKRTQQESATQAAQRSEDIFRPVDG